MSADHPDRVDVVVVAVPARDEAEEIVSCLTHVVAACAGVRAFVAVSAHRCTDDTAERARAALAGVDSLVVEDGTSTFIGEVRARLVRAAAARVPLTSRSWLFNTDADSHVPSDWISATLAQAGGADAVAGLVDLRQWRAAEPAQAAYRALLREGMTGDDHAHVYGANLAVRWDAYLAAGGFSPMTSEDHDLVGRLRATGHTVLAGVSPVVSTSARETGRSRHGLANLLGRLSATAGRDLPRPPATQP